MNLRLMSGLFLLSLGGLAQDVDLWKTARALANAPSYEPGRFVSTIVPTQAEQQVVVNLLRSRAKFDMPGCFDAHQAKWLSALSFDFVNLSRGRRILWVSTPPNCDGTLSGANRPMWLIRFDAGRPVLLASPESGFSGWLYGIEPTPAKSGYRDVILGWHMSVDETTLMYFRYDGHRYDAIATAALRRDRSKSMDYEVIPDKPGMLLSLPSR